MTSDQDKSSDEAAIRSLIAANEASTNDRDAAGVVSTFAEDADLWFAGARRISGLDAIRRNEEEFYRTPGLCNWSIAVESVRFVNSDVALVEGTCTTKLSNEERRDHATLVVTRSEGAWR